MVGDTRGRKGSAQHGETPRPLAHTFFAKPRPIHVVMLALFVVLGLALGTQVRLQRSDPLETLSEEELVQLLAQLDDRNQDLRQESRDLEAQLRELDSEASQQEASRVAAENLQSQAQIAAGLLPVEGSGLVVGVADPTHSLTPQVFVTMLAELRNAGAEAISLNGHRLTLRSWFGQDSGALVVDGEQLEAPYTWRVIGEPQTLATALEIPGGAAAQMRAFNAVVTIDQRENVIIDATAEPFEPKWSVVVEEDS